MQPIRQILSGLKRPPTSADDHKARQNALCASVVRMLHRFGMTGRAEIVANAISGQPPTLIITVERVLIKVSLAAMSMISRQIVGHALHKYGTEIECAYWRLDADFTNNDESHEVTAGDQLIERSFGLDNELESLGTMIHDFEAKIMAAERTLPESADIGDLARHVRDSIDKRRHERGLGGK